VLIIDHLKEPNLIFEVGSISEDSTNKWRFIHIKIKNLTPKSSLRAPENIIGKSVAIVERNQKFPKTLPLKPPGVDACKNVIAGTIIPTKEKPDIKNRGNAIKSLKTPSNSGTKKPNKNREKVRTINEVSIIFFLRVLALRSLLTNIELVIAPRPDEVAAKTIPVETEMPRILSKRAGIFTTATHIAI